MCFAFLCFGSKQVIFSPRYIAINRRLHKKALDRKTSFDRTMILAEREKQLVYFFRTAVIAMQLL